MFSAIKFSIPLKNRQQDDIAGYSQLRERITAMVLIIPSDNASSDPDKNTTVSLRFRLSSDPHFI